MNARLLAAVALLAAGCGDTGSSNDGGSGDQCFIAFNMAFNGFRSWQSYVHDGPAVDDAGVHVSGRRTEYLNHAPPHGSTEFPLGTVIAKEVGDADAGTHHVFAMVKRGCDFNLNGAKDWEWMEIVDDASGGHIIWRGVGPPMGEIYGGNPTGCNSCHQACAGNDSVCSSTILLSSF